MAGCDVRDSEVRGPTCPHADSAQHCFWVSITGLTGLGWNLVYGPEHGSKLSSWTGRPGQVLPSLSSMESGPWCMVLPLPRSLAQDGSSPPRPLQSRPMPHPGEANPNNLLRIVSSPLLHVPQVPCLVSILHLPFRSRFSLDRAPLGKGGAHSLRCTSHSKVSVATKANTCEH